VEESGKVSISTFARVVKNGGTQAYHFDDNGKIVPDNELGLIPEGTEVQILTSLDQDGQRTGWGQYLTEGTVWVSCEIPVGGQSYYGWLISVDDISFDPRLMLPSMWTEG
jgi:imidazole glycerol phosphate synthase subunit HisF